MGGPPQRYAVVIGINEYADPAIPPLKYAESDGKIYFGTQKALFVLAAGKEAKLLSRVNLGSPTYSTPIAPNGVLFVASQRYLWAVQQPPRR